MIFSWKERVECFIVGIMQTHQKKYIFFLQIYNRQQLVGILVNPAIIFRKNCICKYEHIFEFKNGIADNALNIDMVTVYKSNTRNLCRGVAV